MKNYLTLFVTLFFILPAFAQTSKPINYQAVIRDAQGLILANEQIYSGVNIGNNSFFTGYYIGPTTQIGSKTLNSGTTNGTMFIWKIGF